jgi:hypothetical protein
MLRLFADTLQPTSLKGPELPRPSRIDALPHLKGCQARLLFVAQSFRHLKVGDPVVRIFMGIPLELRVVGLTDDFVACGLRQVPQAGSFNFDRELGCEVDPARGWGSLKEGRVHSGSFLRLPSALGSPP